MSTHDPSDQDQAPAPDSPSSSDSSSLTTASSDLMAAGSANANLIYILYLVSVIVGITSLIGVILAYFNRANAPDWVQSHYTFQIHTFWKGLLFGVVGLITMPLLGLGMLVLIATLVWFVIRCVKGMQLISARQPVPDPATWGFG